MRVEQTEIDALASLRPDLLQEIARNALDPFYDNTLDWRVFNAKGEWLDDAQACIDESIDQRHIDRLRAEAEEKLAEMRDKIDAINDALQLDTSAFDLPPFEIPEAEVEADLIGRVHTLPLLDSTWDFALQCKALIDSKAYRSGGA